MLRNTLPISKKLIQFEKEKLIDQLSNAHIDHFKHKFTDVVCCNNDFLNLERIAEVENDLNRNYKLISEKEKQKKSEEMLKQKEMEELNKQK